MSNLEKNKIEKEILSNEFVDDNRIKELLKYYIKIWNLDNIVIKCLKKLKNYDSIKDTIDFRVLYNRNMLLIPILESEGKI